MLKSLAGAFKGGGKQKDPEAEWEQQKKQFYQKIGQLEMERDWLKKYLNSSVSSPEAKRAMIDKKGKLPLIRQCELAYLPRSRAYYRPVGMSARTLELMRLIDKIYTEFPYFGSRQIKRLLRAIALYGPPQVINTDQGSQFTGDDWITVLKDHHIKISMDGRGRALDNVFVERFWRTLKYEEVYRCEYSGIANARKHLADYIEIYNTRRPHSSLDDRTPARVHAEVRIPDAA